MPDKHTALIHVETLIYHYENPCGGDDIEVEVDGPVSVSQTDDGEHHITCADRVGMILPRGWKYIEVFPRFDHEAFTGHPATVNEAVLTDIRLSGS